MFAAASRSRPGIHEKRDDAEPRVYCELPSFPPFDEPVPPEVSLEELCAKYPNHLRGSYFDAFIQWHWSAADMYSCLTELAISEFKSFGISTSKSFANRANFLMKRLDARLTALSAEEVTALCLAPKIRPAMADGTEKYGASKLQGKFHNPSAPAVRKYPYRSGKEGNRNPPQQPAALRRTFVYNDKEYQLWDSAKELQEYSQSMATYWGYQRARVEQIINADAKYRASPDPQRIRLMLQMANWPCNAATETFFSFQYIQDCQAFENAILDLVVAAITNMLDAFPPEDAGQHLQLARQSAVSYVFAGQDARLARLNDLLTAMQAGGSTCGLVDQVLSWTADLDGEFSEAVESDPVPGNSQEEEAVSFFLQNYLESEGTSDVSPPVAPGSKSSKRERSKSPTAVNPVKRVRFADTTTVFGDTGETVNAFFLREEPRQGAGTGNFGPDWNIDDHDTLQHDTAPVVDGEDVVFTLDPPMQELLEGFDLEGLPWDPVQGFLDTSIDLTAADYPPEVDGYESEWAQLLREAGAQDDVAPNTNENGMETSWELPELVDNDPDWLREAIAGAATQNDVVPDMNENEMATLWELPEIVGNDPDWLKKVIAKAEED
ncbi:uncharacterized protein Z520_06800 [Fonsecaea multimorphosa CBS 102226]|uniref:Uncharacterized protein n=1 Tax=Fonsecaea multimorphosa CBS 102226 TaxID=1442371 RepID=A0A0D2KL71_9EURO|nr:uncharacterized protein Z520_06800 [Fonsecaea multimorphosa CBS 102226]KIX97348.1 hypothetical protein Z520_06800 [Fonsecaea multimorphosa CBS 102226]